MEVLQTARDWYVRFLVLVFPLLFLPFTSEFFDFNKLVFLTVGTIVGLVIWAFSFVRGDFKVRVTPLDIPVFVFAGAVLVSSLFVTPNKVDAFVFPGTASVIFACTILYFLVVQGVGNESKGRSSLIGCFVAGGTLASLVLFLSAVGFWRVIGLGRVWEVAGTPTFNTVGGLLPAISLFSILLPFSIREMLYHWYFASTVGGLKNINIKEYLSSKHTALFLLSAVSSVILVLGILFSVWHALPGKPASPKLLPFGTGWNIALEVLKKKPILGVGTGNFVQAFNVYRPVEFNESGVWGLRFATSSNWYLEVFGTVGVVGLLAFGWILFTLWRAWSGQRGRRPFVWYGLLFVLLILAFVPASFVLLFAFYVFGGLVAGQMGRELRFKFASQEGEVGRSGAGFDLISVFFSGFFMLLLVFVLFFGRPVYLAEVYYKQALDAIARNDGLGTYNKMREAIRSNPRVVQYRVTNSQVNLALAISIAQNAAGKTQQGDSSVSSGQGISEQDRNNISQLVQQSIREAKAAVSIHPGLSVAWENLGKTYRAIMPLVSDADRFAIASYRQAIALDPVNPLLRVELGQVFYSIGEYDEASRAFELAVVAKDDLANAHYNLAVSLREQGKKQRASLEFNQALSYLREGTGDYDTVKKAVEDLGKETGGFSEEIQKRESSQGGQIPISAPSALSPVVQPPIQLPEGAAPPIIEEGVTPTPGL